VPEDKRQLWITSAVYPAKRVSTKQGLRKVRFWLKDKLLDIQKV